MLEVLKERFKGTAKELLIKKLKSDKRIFIGDTTLRDGEQAPGASLTADEKLAIAGQLDRLGVDSIEAGFPISSREDFEALRLIAKKVRRPVITALCRCRREDIACAREALKNARRWGLTLFVGTSPILRKYSVKKGRREVIEVIRRAVKYARRFTDNVTFGPEDASRTEPEFLYRVYQEAIKAGALVVAFPDTVGYLTPGEAGEIITKIKTQVSNLNKAFLAVHFHNDLGLAAANTLAAVKKGVNIVQCTVNGIGERAGNASLEEIVMALKARRDYYRAKVSIDTRELYNTSLLVSQLTGLSVPVCKPIVGENVFASEAGIHQAALLKSRVAYEIIKPRSVGQKGTRLVLGRHSGRHALASRIRELGIRLPGRGRKKALEEIYKRFKELAGMKKAVENCDLRGIVREIIEKEAL